MNVLILDDDPARIPVLQRYILQWFAPGSLMNPGREPIRFGVAHTLSGFVQAIRSNLSAAGRRPWDVVFLDRDLHLLQPEERVGGARASGEHAASILSTMPGSLQPRLVVVHSLNQLGARRMMRKMLAAGLHALRKPYRTDGLERWLDQ